MSRYVLLRGAKRADLSVHVSIVQAARQGANSAVRFTTYGTLKVRDSASDQYTRKSDLVSTTAQSFVSGNTRPGETLPAGITFAIGAVAGVVTVYATMPLECVPLFRWVPSSPCGLPPPQSPS